MNVYSVHHSL